MNGNLTSARAAPTPSTAPTSPMAYWPAGTVYGTLLNFQRECELLAPQMTLPPYKAPPSAPVLFVKTANTWSRSGAAVPVPAHVDAVEVGATIAMVIGAATDLSKSKENFPFSQVEYTLFATNIVAYYVLMNDMSLPHASFFRPPVKFKCLDGFLGIGAQQVSANQVTNVSELALEVRINDQLCQTVDFAQMVRSAAQLLADVNEFMTLREGDVLMLGSDCLPGGGRPLARVGDRIDICVPGMPAFGTLSNSLIAETFFDGPPLKKSPPSAGSAAHEVASVGATSK